MVSMQDVIGSEILDNIYWVNKELSWYVRKTDLSGEDAMTFAKNYPMDSEEDEKLTNDCPDELKDMVINGKPVCETAKKEGGFFSVWNRPTTGTKQLHEIFSMGDDADALSEKIFGVPAEKAPEVWADLYEAAEKSVSKNQKMNKADVWIEQPEIKDLFRKYIKRKEEEKKRRAEERKKREAEEEEEAEETKSKAPSPVKMGARK